MIAVYDVLVRFANGNGGVCPLSARKVAEVLGKDKTGVRRALQKLIEAGYVRGGSGAWEIVNWRATEPVRSGRPERPVGDESAQNGGRWDRPGLGDESAHDWATGAPTVGDESAHTKREEKERELETIGTPLLSNSLRAENRSPDVKGSSVPDPLEMEDFLEENTISGREDLPVLVKELEGCLSIYNLMTGASMVRTPKLLYLFVGLFDRWNGDSMKILDAVKGLICDPEKWATTRGYGPEHAWKDTETAERYALIAKNGWDSGGWEGNLELKRRKQAKREAEHEQRASS